MTTDDDPDRGVRPTSRLRLEPRTAFAELGAIVLGRPLPEVLRRIADLALACVPGADEVSVTLVDGARSTTAAFTGQVAVELDERQYESGFGPCLDAARSGQHLRVDDTTDEDVYPDFASAAARHGVHSILCIGLPMPQRVLGAINVYRFSGPALDEESEQLATAFAGYAAVALANAALYASTADLAENLQLAMDDRAVIEQAKGILIARSGCTPEEAFAHLATQSQHRNRKLRELAVELVESVAKAADR